MTRFLDDLARSLARPMPRSRALRLLGGALVSAAVPSLRPRSARGASIRSVDECDDPLRCVGKKTCGIRDPKAGPSPIPVCIVACCDRDHPVCCKWPGYTGAIRNTFGTGSCGQAPFGTVCCCAAGSSCGNSPATGACIGKVCGPDISDALEDAVSRTQAAFAKWSSTQRELACITLVETPIGAIGWEINQLGPGNRDKGAENFRPECATCAQSLSVQVGSGCHQSGSVNYVIYGVVLRLCHDHLQSSRLSKEAPFFTEKQMLRYITLWKTIRGAPNLTASLNWAKAGYNGWPSGQTPPPELPNCAPCPKPLTSRLTVRWLPLDRNI